MERLNKESADLSYYRFLFANLVVRIIGIFLGRNFVDVDNAEIRLCDRYLNLMTPQLVVFLESIACPISSHAVTVKGHTLFFPSIKDNASARERIIHTDRGLGMGV